MATSRAILVWKCVQAQRQPYGEDGADYLKEINYGDNAQRLTSFGHRAG
jgi:hypothetical protein